MRATAVTVCAVIILLAFTTSALPCHADLQLKKIAIPGDDTEFIFDVGWKSVSTEWTLKHLDDKQKRFEGSLVEYDLLNDGLVVTITEQDFPNWDLSSIQFGERSNFWSKDPEVEYDLASNTVTLTLFNYNDVWVKFTNIPGTEVPEPATLGLFALGLGGLFFVRRRLRR